MTSQNPLRVRMIEEMRIRNLSCATQRNYIHHVEQFARHYNTSPINLGLDEIRNYRLHMLDVRLLSPQTMNSFVAAANFLYTEVLDMPWDTANIPYAKVPITLPVFLTAEEIERLFAAVGILKHRAVLMLCYGSADSASPKPSRSGYPTSTASADSCAYRQAKAASIREHPLRGMCRGAAAVRSTSTGLGARGLDTTATATV